MYFQALFSRSSQFINALYIIFEVTDSTLVYAIKKSEKIRMNYFTTRGNWFTINDYSIRNVNVLKI